MKQTSLEAYRRARDTIIPTHHKIILQALKKYGDTTTLGISIFTKLEYHAVARRMKELLKKGCVEEVGRKTDIDGSLRTVYRYANLLSKEP